MAQDFSGRNINHPSAKALNSRLALWRVVFTKLILKHLKLRISFRLAVALFFSLPLVAVQAEVLCRNLSRPKGSLSEQGLKVDSITVLSKTGVILVRDSKAKGHVVRFGSEAANIEFEVFASAFLRSLLGPQILEVKFLDPASRQRILEEIENKDPELSGYLLSEARRQEFLNKKESQASVTDWKSGPLGQTLLNQLGIPDVMFEILWRVQESRVPGQPNIFEDSKLQDEVFRKWQALNPRARDRLETSLAKLLGLNSPWKREEFEKFCTSIRKLSEPQVQEVLDLLLSPLGTDLIRQLSEAWAAYTVLGLTDLHSSNWLQDKDLIIPFDATDFSQHFALNSTELSSVGHHPFGASPISRSVENFMLRHLSPRFVYQLRHSVREKIQQALHENAVGALTPEVVSSMVERAYMMSFSR